MPTLEQICRPQTETAFRICVSEHVGEESEHVGEASNMWETLSASIGGHIKNVMPQEGSQNTMSQYAPRR